MNKYVVGFGAMMGGLLLIIYREKVKNFTGDIGFAEKYLGVGGTWTFYVLLGVASFVFGLMWISGAFQAGFENFFGGFF